jgi:hypothetical protein
MNRYTLRLSLLLATFSFTSLAIGQTTQPATVPATSPTTTSAVPDVQTLVDQSIAAAGGKDKILAIKNLSITGDVTVPGQGIDGTVEVYRKPGKVLMVTKIPQIGEIKMGIDGDVGYQTSDMLGARLLTDVEKKQLLAGMDPQEGLTRFSKMKDLVVTGPEKLGDTRAWKINGLSETGEPESHWLDVKTHQTLMTAMMVNSNGSSIPVSATFSDFKTIDGVTMPTTIRQNMGIMSMVLTLKEIKLNPELADEKFAVPDDVKKLHEQANPKAAPQP